MDDIFVYCVDLKGKAKAFTMPCPDGYTVYIDIGLTREEMQTAYDHEVRHIENGDFDTIKDVQYAEHTAHL